jgi:hypothetical protein
MRRYLIVVIAIVVTACTALSAHQLDRRYGTSDNRRFDRDYRTDEHRTDEYRADAATPISFERHVRPILESRCTVCHGCYDAPCQLKLDSFEGLTRGAHKEKVYDGTRLIAANLTRMFEDAHSNAQWREKGFYPVLNERANTAKANRDGSVLLRMLTLKQANPLPPAYPLPDTFDFSLDREQSCPKIEEFPEYARKHPLAGMPYGLPALSAEELTTIRRWIELGSPRDEMAPLHTSDQQQIALWELFLNGNSLKQQLMSRYIYEHWFLAHLYFNEGMGKHFAKQGTDTAGKRTFFRLVRSRTPPGTPIELIATRRPFDDPGAGRVYYRLQRDISSVLEKTHMPYLLDNARMQRLRELFLDPAYKVTELPSYKPDTASNPFKTFEQLPVQARYKLMLDEAQFTIMGFIKGPVCRGQVALNVINDQFWVYFVNPDLSFIDRQGQFLAEHSDKLRMPAEQESTAPVLLSWLTYSRNQKEYLQAKAAFYRSLTDAYGAPNLALVWDGSHTNHNAALTVFRHFDSATVVKGNVGLAPKTAWLIDYSLLERIHYLLVAGFDVYGNVGHQLYTRLYMDFLRMEGEYNFLTLLPKKARKQELDFWYRSAGLDVTDYISWHDSLFDPEPNIVYHSSQPKLELYSLLQQHLGRAIDSPLPLRPNDAPALHALQAVEGTAASIMPQLSFVRIDDGDSRRYITITSNSAHSNISHLFRESQRRLPQEDSLSVAHGIVGAYPNALFRVDANALGDFVASIAALKNELDYRHLVQRFGIARNAADFWQFSDQMAQDHHMSQPITSGLLDYNRLENR